VGHILVDGMVEPHATTEERLLAMSRRKGASLTGADLFDDRDARLAEAYRRRARAVAAPAKP
jgi:hypothetical protein